MKLLQNNKLFPYLNEINGNIDPYVSKGVIRNHNYRYDPKLVQGVVAAIRISCSCHAFTTKISLPWGPKLHIHLSSQGMGEFMIATMI